MHQHRFSTTFSGAIAVTGVVLSLAACTGDPGPDAPSITSPATAVSETGSTASPTPPALPEQRPATHGPAATDCVNGWATPARDSATYAEPLRVIRRMTGVRGPLVIVDMRSFEGPESPPSDKGYLLDIRRWYVKLFAKDDPAFQGRFIVESRTFGTGLVAVAPYDTNGFRSPDWMGFQFDSADPLARPYPGLPGRWAGIPYDFVAGGAGLEIAGLPDEVVGCLSAT